VCFTGVVSATGSVDSFRNACSIHCSTMASAGEWTYRRQINSVTNMQSFIAPLLASVRRRRESSRLLRDGNRLYQNGQFADAADSYRRAAEIDPERLVLRFNLGLALYKAGEKREGRAEWEAVRDLARGRNDYMAEQAEIMLRQFS
jgi:tetratricopeptide (TPR) repeat protein